MKKILIFLFVLPTLAWSQNFFTGAPKVIELVKYRSPSGQLELRYVQENPHRLTRLSSAKAEIKDFGQKLLDSDIDKVSCDGDFSITFDAYGRQYIQINSIKVCLDKEGWVVAHSFGIPPLDPVQLAASTRIVEESRLPVKADPAIFQGNVPKVVNPNSGVFLARKSEAPTQAK
jgi:hypothetical protein